MNAQDHIEHYDKDEELKYHLGLSEESKKIMEETANQISKINLDVIVDKYDTRVSYLEHKCNLLIAALLCFSLLAFLKAVI